jgi:glycosyltransferase involved in cell wall biosynthesis
MAQVLFVLEQPTPQRTPALDKIWDNGIDLVALYHAAEEDTARGWGPLPVSHPYLPIPRGRARSCLFTARQVLRREVRVVCCFGYHRPANVVAVLLARARRARVVTRSDSNWLAEVHRPWWRRCKRVALRLIFGRRTRVWTVGTQNDRYWREMGLPRRHLIPYGLPAPPIGTVQEGAALRHRYGLGPGLVVLYVGVLEPRKGIDTLLEAFQALPDQAARLLVVGGGSLASRVAQAARVDPRIVAFGPATQAALGPIYAAADLFVLPSRAEPWGLVINEAQANGLPVVVSDAVGAAADLVTPANGWVFPAGDAGQLAEILGKAAAVPPARLERRHPYNAAAAMLADLTALGATARIGRHARRDEGTATLGERSGWVSGR